MAICTQTVCKNIACLTTEGKKKPKSGIQILPIVPHADFNRRNFNLDSGVWFSIFLSSALCYLFPTHPLNIEPTPHNISPSKIFSFKLWLTFPMDFVRLNGECWQVSASAITSWRASSCHLLWSFSGAISWFSAFLPHWLDASHENPYMDENHSRSIVFISSWYRLFGKESWCTCTS